MLTMMLSWRNKIQAPYSIMLISDSFGFDLLYPSLSGIQNDDRCNILLAYEDALKQDKYSLVTHEQWFWKSLLEDAKCSVAFSCLLCCFDTQSLGEVTKHMESEEHAFEESLLQPEAAPSPKMATRKQPERKAKKMRMTYEHELENEHEHLLRIW